MASAELGQIQDFLLVFKRRIWQVLLPALFVLAGGVVFAVIVPKKYAVWTRIELLQPTVHVGDAEASATLREVDNIYYHLKNRDRIEATIVAGNWAEYALMDDQQKLDFVESVQDDVGVEVLTQQGKNSPNSSVFVEIKYADVDGKRAVRFLSALTESWIKDVVQRDYNQMVAERDEFQNAVLAAQKNYDDLTKQQTDLWAEMGISFTQADGRNSRVDDPTLVALTGAQQELGKALADLEEQRAKIAAVQENLDATDPEIRVTEETPGLDLGLKLAELAFERAELEKMFVGRSPQNSNYKKAQREIDAVDKEVETITALQRAATQRLVWKPNPAQLSLANQMAALRLEEAGLAARHTNWVAEVKERVALYNRQSANYDVLIRLRKASDHAGDELDEATGRLRAVQARIAAYDAVQEQPYRVVDPARAPLRPTEPNPFTIVLVSVLGGIALGLGIAFLAEYSKSCYRSVGDLSRSLGVPILGVVNRVYTRSDLRARRSKRLVIGGSTAVILACVAWFTYAWSYDRGLLKTGIVQFVEDVRLKLR
jgi:uncharacterized protein involved in exopolysaccharide biosynthesis